MYRLIQILLIAILFFVISSCSVGIDTYENTQPEFDLKNYFNGELIAWGMIQDYTNKVNRRFCVELNATWQGEQGQLAEKFYFDDGEISFRTWYLNKLPQGAYSGTAEDVVGIAKGKQSGFAFQWQYQLLVPIANNTYQFSMDDWMYQMNENKVLNKTSMSKFGLKVAEITLVFDKNIRQKTCH